MPREHCPQEMPKWRERGSALAAPRRQPCEEASALPVSPRLGCQIPPPPFGAPLTRNTREHAHAHTHPHTPPTPHTPHAYTRTPHLCAWQEQSRTGFTCSHRGTKPSCTASLVSPRCLPPTRQGWSCVLRAACCVLLRAALRRHALKTLQEKRRAIVYRSQFSTHRNAHRSLRVGRVGGRFPLHHRAAGPGRAEGTRVCRRRRLCRAMSTMCPRCCTNAPRAASPADCHAPAA